MVRDGQRQGLPPAPSNLTPKSWGAQEGGRQLGQANGAPQSNCGCPTVLGQKREPRGRGTQWSLEGQAPPSLSLRVGSSGPHALAREGALGTHTSVVQRDRGGEGEGGASRNRDHGAEFTVQRSHSRMHCTKSTELLSEGPQTVLPSRSRLSPWTEGLSHPLPALPCPMWHSGFLT